MDFAASKFLAAAAVLAEFLHFLFAGSPLRLSAALMVAEEYLNLNYLVP